MPKVAMIIEFDLPEGASEDDAESYTLDAVHSYCGGLHPDDPMFELDRNSVVVHGAKRKNDD